MLQLTGGGSVPVARSLMASASPKQTWPFGIRGGLETYAAICTKVSYED